MFHCMSLKTVARTVAVAAFVAASFTASSPANAGSDSDAQKPAQEACEAKHRHGHHGDEFDGRWEKTLSAGQISEIATLKVALKKELSQARAAIEVKRTEARAMVASDDPDRAALARLVDEIATLERDAMNAKYGHMIKVRSLLTPEQKAAFDMAIMKKEGRKDGKKGGRL